MSTPEPHWIDDAECPSCGGEGVVYDCFDGCCQDAEWGCEECERPCDCQRKQAPSELGEVLAEALASSLSSTNGK